MTGKDLFREVGNISEKYISEAEETKKSIIHNVVFRRSLGTVACLVLCVGIFVITRSGGKSTDMTAADSMLHYVASSENTAGESDGTNNVEMNMAESYAPSDSGSSLMEDATVSEEAEINKNEETEYDFERIADRLQAYPNEYAELLQAEAFVVVHGNVKAGLNTWESFLEDSQKGISASVDLIQFTIEGDAIITGIVYDGETYHVVMDYTRDAWGMTGIVEYEYKYLYRDTRDGYTDVVLSDLELEADEIKEAIMSDGLDIHYLVQYKVE